MIYTASFQNNGAAPNYKHNRRDKDYIGYEKNSSVDLQRQHITIIDLDPVQVYCDEFGEALDEWNDKNIKNRHNDRVLTMEQYIAKIKKEEKEYRREMKKINSDKSLSGKEKQKAKNSVYGRPRFVYEAIVQIGNIDTVPAVGTDERKQFDETIKDIYIQYLDEWKKNNPNLILTGAYLHFDEAGASHMHIDYIPVAKGLKRGMSTAPKLVEAILQMGYEKGSMTYTPQMQWQDRQRDIICEIAKQHGIEATFEDRRRSGQKIIKQYHLNPTQYKMEKIAEAKKEIAEAKKEINTLKEENSRLVKENDELSARRKRQYNAIEDSNKIINKQREMRQKIDEDIGNKKKESLKFDLELEKKKSILDKISITAAEKAKKILDEAEEQARAVLEKAKEEKRIELNQTSNQAAEILANAYEEADNIRMVATDKAEQILDDAERKKKLLEEDIAESEKWIKTLNEQKEFIKRTIDEMKKAAGQNFDVDFINRIKEQAELKLRRSQDEVFEKFFNNTTNILLAFDEKLPYEFSSVMQENLDNFYGLVNQIYIDNGYAPPYQEADEEIIDNGFER